MAVTPSRIRLARMRRGYTIGEAADAIRVERHVFGQWESGTRVPAPEELERLSVGLRFPESFFSQPDCALPDRAAATFRASSRRKSAELDAALAAGVLAREFSAWIDARFPAKEAAVPDLRRVDPETAADLLRQEMNLGHEPVESVVALLERLGVRVFALDRMLHATDAFCGWFDGTPFVFLNTSKSAERSRFDAAHELGHLVLHHEAARGRDIEQEADAFASAFLMPCHDVLARATRTPSLAALIKQKRRWGVSVMALAHRLHALKMITPWHYRQLCIEATKQGMRVEEPEGMRRELSPALQHVFGALRANKQQPASIAKDLHITTEEMESLVLGLAILGLGGDRLDDGQASQQAAARDPGLKLVPR